jgi:hypothetical protein
LPDLKVLESTIKDELGKLRLLDKEKEGLLKTKPSKYSLRAGGSILHDFYTEVEKIFEDIAKEIYRRVPIGEGWHSELLHQMTLEIPGLRPPIISRSTEKNFANILGFVISFGKDMDLNLTG